MQLDMHPALFYLIQTWLSILFSEVGNGMTPSCTACQAFFPLPGGENGNLFLQETNLSIFVPSPQTVYMLIVLTSISKPRKIP